jgi:large repetitive protein
MKKHLYFSALLGLALILSACNIGVTATPNPILDITSTLSLLVQVQNPTDTFDTVGDVISYIYVVTNAGTEPMAGPVQVNDNIALVTCPDLTTVGNQDNTLDPGESITCNGAYSLTQAALDAGSVTNVATASVAGGTIVSVPSGITVNLTGATPGKSLGLTKTANPLTYSQAGQTITYTYVIANTGSLAVGPTQFMIVDDHLGGTAVPFTCGPDATLINPGESISCTATYTITQQDMNATSVTNTATASGGDAQASPAVSATITNVNFQSNITPTVTSGPSNLTPGTTIQHVVVKGEWLIQIARCYGVRYENLRNANLNIPNPHLIEIGQIVTVPNIGSAGTIFGTPCVVLHTVVAGDTWNSIATRYIARVDVLQAANPAGLVTGAVIKVPINSAAAGAVQIPVTGAVTSTSNTPTVTNTPVTVTVTPTVGTTTPGGATRITFPAGQTSTSVSGALVGHQTLSYVLTANQGQTLTATLSANVNEIAMRIYDPNGLLVKPLDGNLTWTGLLAATGDYRIDLVGLTDPTKNYILTVALTGP